MARLAPPRKRSRGDLSWPAIRATACAEGAQAIPDKAAEDAGEPRVKGLAQERGIVILE